MTVWRSAAVLGVLMAGLTAEAQWRSLPVRSRAEFELGLPGGEAEQHLQGMARSESNPDRIYLSHDVGQVWRSDDNGRTWRHTVCHGMRVQAGQSIAVDPANPDTVLVLMSRAWDYLSRDFQGIYRSEDGGANWKLVLKVAEVDHQRSMQRTIAWDPTSLAGNEAKRWYAGVAGQALHHSADGGRTWTRGASLEGHRPLYGVVAHPTLSGILYVHSAAGLFASTDGGASLSPLGNLPKGEVRSLDINPADPLDFHATVDGAGLFRSRNSGTTFGLVKEFNAQYAAIHPRNRDRIYLVGRQNAHMLTSHDGGATWLVPKVVPIPGWDREDSGWKTRINGVFSTLLPDPRNPDSAVGIANATLYRTEDGGLTFTDSSAGFTGYAWGWFTRPVAFDAADPKRFAFFCYDVGAVITENGGDWFERRGIPWVWKRDKRVEHTGMYAGDFSPEPGSQTLVATAGIYWKQVIVRSEDAGRNWTIVDETPAHNLFLSFHRQDASVVYADAKRSDDGGRTFHRLPNLPEEAAILGLSPARSDTVYALNKNRTIVYRSDDRGESWRVYTEPGWALRKLDPKPTFLVCPADPDRLYAVDARGDLASFDGTAWRSLGVLALAGGADQGNFVRAVAVDPRQPEVLYAGLHAPGLPLLFRSADGGKTWQDISGDLPRIGIGGLVVHPLTGEVFTGGIAGTRIRGE